MEQLGRTQLVTILLCWLKSPDVDEALVHAIRRFNQCLEPLF
jgi:hypothetical protein